MERVEPRFRDVLASLLRAEEGRMPEPLWEEAWDHLYRHDGQGKTLCFNGPIREDLMRQLLPWLDTHMPKEAARLRAVYQPLGEWPGPEHYPPEDRLAKD